jgi:signal peptidase I
MHVRTDSASTARLDKPAQAISGSRAAVECPHSLHLEQLRFGNLMEDKPVPCGDGYYVLGDELKDSDDSRFNGPVPARRVMGRAWLIIWPWKRAGWIR